MISVVIPTLNAASGLPRALNSLLEANVAGLIREVIITDGGSEDETPMIAEFAGARFVSGKKGRGVQLRAGASLARGEWLLFLHADTALHEGWEDAAKMHMATAHDRVAGVFQLAFDQAGVKPALVAMGANLRARLFGLPYGDQGLLISRAHYDRLGGFADMPLFEDVDLIRRVVKAGGRRALRVLPAQAITSAERYVAEGYFARVFRNARCVRMYFSGAPISRIIEVYRGPENRLRTTSHHDGEAAPDGKGQDKA
ncbi:MAG: TIGR04283 family arsenosugar biosynthesis glycosyltransferase [Parvularcula sp.]